MDTDNLLQTLSVPDPPRWAAPGHHPQRLVPVEAPEIKGLMTFGAELEGTGTRFFRAWTESGGIFIGWMRTRPSLVPFLER